MKNFKVVVGQIPAPATIFVESDYQEVCAYSCKSQPTGRKYFTCGRPIEGNHVAVLSLINSILALCEIEIYADIYGESIIWDIHVNQVSMAL